MQLSLSGLIKIAVPVAAAGVAIAVPAYASSTGSSGPGTAGTGQAAQSVRGPALITSGPGIAPRTAAQAVTASAACVRYATRAGWANNGYFAGDLVTAAAICVAESHGDPALYTCDNSSGQIIGHGDFIQGQPVTCPAGTVSYDRGLWQLNTAVSGAVSDDCAFSPVCNAKTAYLASQRGTSFVPWSSYDNDTYARQIDPAQSAVTGLHSGTVTSAELGECLAQARSAAGAKVVLANCGAGAITQQWIVSGGKLRSGSVCAAIASTSAAAPGIVLRRCAAQKVQHWTLAGRGELRNGGDGKCLTDPNGSLNSGTQVIASRCTNAKSQVWWRP